MTNQLQVTTIGPEAQPEVLDLLAELRGWQDLGVDILEARAIGNYDGLDECTKAVAEMLRETRQRVIVLKEPTKPTTSGNAPASAGAAEEIGAEASPSEEPGKRPSRQGRKINITDADRQARRELLVLAHAVRKAQREAAANGAGPAPEPTDDSPAPTGHGRLLDLLEHELQHLYDMGTMMTSDVLHEIAQRHNTTLYTVEAVQDRIYRRRMDRAVREEQAAEKATRRKQKNGDVPSEKAAEVSS